MKINLVNNGIFPIIYDADGELLPDIPDTGYDVPGTLQGEGLLTGTPCLFIRTSSCNLRCSWLSTTGKGSPCDTPYSSHKPEKNIMDIENIVNIITANSLSGTIRHVVISGGEPTIQTESLSELLRQLQAKGFHTTIETNATVYSDSIAKYTDLVSMSPKLRSSTPWEANLKDTGIAYSEKWAMRHERDRKNIPVIQQYIDACYHKLTEIQGREMQVKEDLIGDKSALPFEIYPDYARRKSNRNFQLKFVVTDLNDFTEIETDFISKLKGVRPEDIFIMPEGVTPEELMLRSQWISKECIARGWRFTPRLHTMLWGTKRGV
jgi:7-carboxy-7-deazaguanine synthase